MCGIVGYIGIKQCKNTILSGLERLEYRGYDSAGFACISNKTNKLTIVKKAGKVAALREALQSSESDGTIGIAHSRWATHGVVNDANAHPHTNCFGTIAVVHNGIIEGFAEIKEKLVVAGHVFQSNTDTEVIAHLLSSLIMQHKTFHDALTALFKQLAGSYALVFLLQDYPDQLIIVRNKSPLVAGLGFNEAFVASDVLAIGDKITSVLFMPDQHFAVVKRDSIDLYDFAGTKQQAQMQPVDMTYTHSGKQGFAHYMLKEIYEQKNAIARSLAYCKQLSVASTTDNTASIWKQLGITKDQVKKLRRINLAGAGTSWHACRIAQFFFEGICKIPTFVHLATEFRYMPFFPEEKSVYMFVSQSGETADTLEAMRMINDYHETTIAITNVQSSSIAREAHGYLPMQAGPEISVASTKAFSSQISILYWLANIIAHERGDISTADMHKADDDLLIAADALENAIERYKHEVINTLAKKYARYDRFIFLGRHISYPFALEAALKLKEISYRFAQCYPAGELKHGPIALIDAHTPVIFFSSSDPVIYAKLVSNAQEVKSRNGHVISFAFDGQDELINLSEHAFTVPAINPYLGPLTMTGIMQFFTYHITLQLGHSIDQPRNLAKSVTVE